MSHSHGGAAGGARVRNRRRGVVALTLVAALLAIAAVPALAHQTITVHPDGSYATMLSEHNIVFACDEDSDGNRAYVRRIANGGQVLDPIYDPNGAGGSCGGTPIDIDNLESYNICVQNEGCGTPIYRSQF